MIAIIIPFQMLQGLQTGLLSGFEAFRSLAVITFIDLLLLIAIVPGGILLFGLNGAIAGYVLVAVIGCLIRWLKLSGECLRHDITVRIEMQSTELYMLWSGAGPLVLLWIVWQSA